MAKQTVAAKKKKKPTQSAPAAAKPKLKPAPAAVEKTEPLNEEVLPPDGEEAEEETEEEEEEGEESEEEGDEEEEEEDEESETSEAATPKKKKRKIYPDGTKQEYYATDGSKIIAVWRNEKLCCTSCKRKLPVTAPLTPAQRKAKAKARKEAAIVKGQEMFLHFAALMKKQAEKAGEPPPTNKQILAMMAAGAE